MDNEYSVLIYSVLFALGLVIYYLIKTYVPSMIESRIDGIVLAKSSRIKALNAVNDEFQFVFVPNEYNIERKYDNKNFYNKIDPHSLFLSELREKVSYYQDVVNKVRNNRTLYKEYKKRITSINSNIFQECAGHKIPMGLLVQREDALFERQTKEPTIDVDFKVCIRYKSPMGRVDVSKEKVFYFNDVVLSLESVSKEVLDREKYQKIAAVERANVSDSMRYDIMLRDGFKCVLCGASQSQGVVLHIDHIVPISKGGKSTKDNLRTLCERCNVGKSDKIEITPETTKEEHKRSDKFICPNCGNKLVWRNGKYGEFLGCASYPDCKYTRSTVEK